LKTTGPLDIDVADVVFEGVGSKRFAYKESPPLREGLGAEGFDILKHQVQSRSYVARDRGYSYVLTVNSQPRAVRLPIPVG